MKSQKSTINFITFSFIIFLALMILPMLAAAQGLRVLTNGDERKFKTPRGHTEYQVIVKTSDVPGAGTDSGIYLTIEGYGVDKTQNVNLGGRLLRTAEANLNESGHRNVTFGPNRARKRNAAHNYFERNDKHQINVIAKDVGKIRSIKIRKNNWGAGPDWHLEYVQIKKNGKSIKFDVSQWISNRTYTFTNENKLYTNYTVEIYTGALSGAGTDSNIYLTIEGYPVRGRRVTRAIPKVRINGFISGNAFERNQIDKFVLKKKTYFEGGISRIIITSDNKYAGSAWYLGWVRITDHGGKQTYFFANRWIKSGKLTAVLYNR